MCGIAGFIAADREDSEEQLFEIASQMGGLLWRRGPDDSGVWVDSQARVGLAHRRLAVVDLSATGHQPMVSSCGRFVIVYNGEVYNHHELRAELASSGRCFRGASDTEVVLEACAEWSVEVAVTRFLGMFAFALWDRKLRTLTLVRDRLGIKPLYYAEVGGSLLFASELKAFRPFPTWNGCIDTGAVASYLRHGYIPAPATIFRAVRKLRPGELLTCTAEECPAVRCNRYWDLRAIAAKARAHQDLRTEEDAIDSLEALLLDAVKRRMISDVPLGAFLSGGIDSSLVVALMQRAGLGRVKTFTIGFTEERYNEAHYARSIANHLKTDHHEFYATPKLALELIPSLPDVYDEPFADSSQIPTCILSRFAREHVTVALSGDGGDELFGGYQRYFITQKLWRLMNAVPLALRTRLATLCGSQSTDRWAAALAMLPPLAKAGVSTGRLQRIAHMLPLNSADDLYCNVLSTWADPEGLMADVTEPRGVLWDRSLRQEIPSFLERMQLLDSITYLPDDILTKVDRASMAVSLEARVPILDHRLVEFAWLMSPSHKFAHGEGKAVLRRLLGRYVPMALTDRPKMGFGVPVGEWIRGPLRDWAEVLMDERKMREDGLLNVVAIRRVWKQHVNREYESEARLWNVLMLQAWLRRWTD